MKTILKIIFLIGFIFAFRTNINSQPITWQRVLNFTDVCTLYKAHQTSDGGYIVVGETRVNNYGKTFLAKLNRYGDTLWTKYFNLNLNEFYAGFWIEETFDKGFIVAGRGLGTDLIKTDSLGNIQWYRNFAGSGARCVKQTKDKGYILLIITHSLPTTDILVVRTDSLGNGIWSKIYGGNNFAEYALEIEILNNSGFILAGTVRPGHENLYLLRLDDNGDTLWSKSYTKYLSSEGYSIDITNDDGFIIGGTCDSLDDNNKKAYVIKTDSSGNVQWQRRYTTNFNEWCFSIRQLKNSGYVMCGMSDSLHQCFERGIVRILDEDGNNLREKYYRPGPKQHELHSVEETNDNGFILCGYADIGSGLGFMVRTDSLLNIKPVGIWENAESLKDYQLFQNYPNPFNPSTTISFALKKNSFITLKVFDITGKEIKLLINENKQAGSYDVTFNSTGLTSGIYFYQIWVSTPSGEAEDFSEVKKMVVLK